MSRHDAFISALEFAALAGMSRQRASRVLANGHYKGCDLVVRTVEGRGGNAGMQYQVRLDSLPEELQALWKLNRKPLEARSNHVRSTGVTKQADWFRLTFGEVLKHPQGSRERGAAKAELNGKEAIDWSGNRMVLNQSTFDKWIKKYEEEGLRAFVRQQRSDKGQRRIIVSREWDRLVAGRFDEDIMQRIARELHDYIAGLHQKGTERKLILSLAQKRLDDLTRQFGYRPEDPTRLRAACKISIATSNRFLHHRKVYRHMRDRKSSYDTQPRIRRTIAGLRPMQLVVADWHHCNVLVRKSDGSTATPKLIGFMDIATRRVWCELAFFEERGGPRNTHGLRALANMAAHPAFGMPEHLYLDNGKEFLFGDVMSDAMRLVRGSLLSDREDPVIRALPYNAAAKPIEAWFGHFENTYLQHLQGYIGDDRMNPKREQLGRLPAPFGSFEQFSKTFFQLLDAYETIPVGGQLRGQSPREAFNRHAGDGWAATVAGPDDIFMACCKPQTRNLRNHAFSFGGEPWTCDELLSHQEDKVVAFLPRWNITFPEIRVEDMNGKLIGYATRMSEYGYLDPSAAGESARRKSLRNRSLTAQRNALPEVDVVGDLKQLAAEHAPARPNEPNGVISLSKHRHSKSGAVLPEDLPTPADRDREAEARANHRALQRRLFEQAIRKDQD